MKDSIGVSETQFYGIFCLMLLFFSGIFIGIYDLGWKIFAPLFLFFVFLGQFRLSEENISDYFFSCFCKDRLSVDYKELLTGIISIFPIVTYFAVTFRQEFPFLGDHILHLMEDVKAGIFWLNIKYQAALFVITFILSIKFKVIKYWLPVAFLFLIWSSYYETRHEYNIFNVSSIRYPALGRTLSLPFISLALLIKADFLYNYSRLVNVAMLVAWIYIFRPFFLNRKPNFYVFLYCLLFLYQESVIYYFNTNYLEPLSSIFLLLSIECLFVYRQEKSYIASCLLVGLAAMIKEQAILVLPWVWLAGKPWTWNKTQWTRGVIVGITSIVPFFTYYLLRIQKLPTERSVNMIPLAQWFDKERYFAGLYRFYYHVGMYGLIALCIAFIFSIIILIKHKEYRATIFCILAAALTQFVFFFADSYSSKYLGYFRFSFIPVALILSTVLLSEKLIKDAFLAKFAGIILFFIAIYMFFPFLKKTYIHDVARNFVEHTDAPIYFPISRLVEKAESKHLLKKGDNIYIYNTSGYHSGGIKLHYRRMENLYSLDPSDIFRCNCGESVKIVMIPFVCFSGMSDGLKKNLPTTSPFPLPPKRWMERWLTTNRKKDQCYKEMKSTCSSVVTETFNGELIGLLGIKR